MILSIKFNRCGGLENFSEFSMYIYIYQFNFSGFYNHVISDGGKKFIL